MAEVPAADYVAGAIAAEMPASYEEDALIAQGMSAYTNAHYLAALRRADPPEELNGADFSADPAKRLGYVTDDTRKWEPVEAVQPADGVYTLTLPARSVVSYTGTVLSSSSL